MPAGAAIESLDVVSPEDVQAYERDGYLIARGLFRPEEVAEIKSFFDDLGRRGQRIEGHWWPDTSPEAAGDPLRRYPRVMHPHLFDPMSRRYLIDPRLKATLTRLLGDEPLAVQTMYYFKPPGARGQALHQDNFYLRVKPGTCIAAWVAIDRSHPDNGGLYVCPGTHRMEVVCPEQADANESFTTELVNPPAGIEPVPAILESGDVLFFNGSVVHGSKPNRTKDEWRRSFICHYMPRSSSHISVGYHAPMIDFDGNKVTREASAGGGPCGTSDLDVPH